MHVGYVPSLIAREFGPRNQINKSGRECTVLYVHIRTEYYCCTSDVYNTYSTYPYMLGQFGLTDQKSVGYF